MPTFRRGLWRQFELSFTFKPLACQAVLDLNVFEFGRVAQYLETRVRGATFLIVSSDGLLADHRRFSRYEAHRILRPDVYQSLRVLGQSNFNVFLAEFFDGRQVRRVGVPSLKGAHRTSSEVADAEARDKHNRVTREVRLEGYLNCSSPAGFTGGGGNS